MGILNYTTTVSAEKTASELVAYLAKHGASHVGSTYDAGRPTGVTFGITTKFGPRAFQLPVNVAGVAAALKREHARGEIDYRAVRPGQAERVAWRILKDWTEAQIALIDAGQAELDEVMLPYMVTPTGATVAQIYRERGHLAIEGAS